MPVEAKIHTLVATLVPREEPHPDIFMLLTSCRAALQTEENNAHRSIEVLAVLRLLHILGYSALHEDESWPRDVLGTTFSSDVLQWIESEHTKLLKRINDGLNSAVT
jgi:hypothetical protein